MKKQEPTYILVYQKQTDGEILLERKTAKEIRKITEKMSRYDYAIISGVYLKTFNSLIDLKELK